jgi:hypothetical protein
VSVGFEPFIEGNVKVPRNRLESPEGGRGIALHFLTSALEGGGWSAPHPSRFTPGKTGIAATELPLHVHLGLELTGPLCAAI